MKKVVVGIIRTREIGEPGSEAYERYNKPKLSMGEIGTHEERMKVAKQFKEQGSIGMVEYYGPNDMKWENKLDEIMFESIATRRLTKKERAYRESMGERVRPFEIKMKRIPIEYE